MHNCSINTTYAKGPPLLHRSNCCVYTAGTITVGLTPKVIDPPQIGTLLMVQYTGYTTTDIACD